MPDETVFASLRDWEDGTDLVLSTTLPTERSAAWLEITDPVRCGEWFAPWRRVNTTAEATPEDSATADRADDPTADGESDGRPIAFVFDDDTLEAHVVSVVSGEHVLLEFAGLGRVGISLEDADGRARTRVAVTHTFESRDAAEAVVPEIGPVWHTHLLMLASALGAAAIPPDDAALTAYYTQVADGRTPDGVSAAVDPTGAPGEGHHG